MQLQWRNDSGSGNINQVPSFDSSTHDYAIIAVPFSVVKNWRLPATLPTLLKTAITNLNYDTSCKVALEFSSRFWEQYENPIFGGCNTATDIPEIGVVCYPSYDINGTGPASILASYTWLPHANRVCYCYFAPSDHWTVVSHAQEMTANPLTQWISVPETEHVAWVLDAMVEIHGESIRNLYTGNYKRKCWLQDPFAAGGWASPIAGQHELYMSTSRQIQI